MHDLVERVESVKAGTLSGIAAGIGYGVVLVIDRMILARNLTLDLQLLVQIAIAIIGGFLFGVTYRYIIRTDRNGHLNAGAVLAFGLVRGLAQVNVSDLNLAQLWLNGAVVIESILLFAIARSTIDYAFRLGWIAPFKSVES